MNLNLSVTNPDGLSYPALGKNLSREGIFICSPQIVISPYSLVELAFCHDELPFRLEAMVVHNNQRGMGVLFREPQDALYLSVKDKGIPIGPVFDIRQLAFAGG
jgi:hypothetical protein